ncbi:Diaminopimelate epimerase-like protein [Aspergillus sclerotioniger CBS 115572]|uniref:Diaminopimelate epimerase-like protein n=1 Tax=Aspergillus sclerotioniger CBS 115572 TaxID=1450535 RepID=A0A317WI53_9EURO|nr:Diaminopimelate epimerase-like protein [Aspergillus sclerotioniger CBS 115572]PWY83890.1 Diaminopimelate epimerase-like protein [Aspergillus sclerotioniger CBS 115572]
MSRTFGHTIRNCRRILSGFMVKNDGVVIWVILELFHGNPVSIITLPNSHNPSHAQKQNIAQEFNLSETVFLYTDGPNPHVDIFIPVNEMEFAGHPIIGTGHLLFQRCATNTVNLTVITKAGPVPLTYDRERKLVYATVPHNVHIHQREATVEQIGAVQRVISESLDLCDLNKTYPVISIVKGVTFALVDLTQWGDTFAKLGPGASPTLELDEDWISSLTGVMYYRLLDRYIEGGTMVWDLRVRMIAINLEDPACGSGGCSLSAYLALSRGRESRAHRFNISQGE